MAPRISRDETCRSSTIRQAAWIDWSEWTEVKELLFSGSLESRKRGVDYVEMWRSRSSKIPPAIIATAEIVSLLDGLPERHLSDICWRLAASMCIVRTVNLIIDPLQKKKYAVAVSGIAEEIGLPKWIVRVRHQATHSAKLPSLAILVSSCGSLLGWMAENYWGPQSELLKSAEVRICSVFSELGRCRKSSNKITKRERLLIREILSIESTGDPIRAVASLLIEKNIFYDASQVHEDAPAPLEKKILSWAKIMEEMESCWPGFMLQLLHSSVEYASQNAEDADTISRAKFLALFFFSKCVKTDFLRCMKIISSRPSPITSALLREASRAHPDKRKSINRLLTAFGQIKRHDLRHISIPPFPDDDAPAGGLEPSFDAHAEPWGLSNISNWKNAHPIGTLPGSKAL